MRNETPDFPYYQGRPAPLSNAGCLLVLAAGAAAGVSTLLIAWLCDRIGRRRGDWIHYTGVAVWIMMGCTQLAAYVYYVWLPTLKPGIEEGGFPAYGY